MSGILGLWNFDGEPIEPALLAELSAIQAHRGADGNGCWTDGPVAFVFQNLWVTPESVGEIQPLVRQGTVVLFDGRLDNRPELLDMLADSPVSKDSSDAALVSAAYERFGETLPEKLAGDFALALYDIPQEKLLLARDGIGVRPLYYAPLGKGVMIASECKPILAHPKMTPKPNADMLAAYFLACFGQERQGWTFFDGIFSVLPGQLVVIRRQSVVKRTYWDFGVPEPIRFKTLDEYAEVFRYYFEQAVARRLRSAYPVAISLSGGLDSSSIFCTAETIRREGTGYPKIVGIHMSGNTPLADESRFVDEIERRYAVQVHRLPYTGAAFVKGSVSRGLRNIEAPYLRGMMDFDYPVERAAKGARARVLLTGIWGDQMLSNQAYWIDLAKRGQWSTVIRHVREFARWYTTESPKWYFQCLLHELLRAPIPGSWMPLAREARRRIRGDRSWFTPEFWRRARRAEVLQRFMAPGRTVYQRSVYETVRPMYYFLAMDWIDKVASRMQLSSSYPFFDRDLIRFLMAIPGEVPCWGGVPKALLRSAMKNTLPPEIAERRWKADATQEFNESVNRDFERFAKFLQGDVMSVKLGFLDGHRLASALRGLRNRIPEQGCSYTWQLVDIFALELWLQCFFGTKGIDSLEESTENVTTNA